MQEKNQQIEVIANAPLSRLTFWGLGGPADELYRVHSFEGFGEIWAETIALKLPKIIMGRGSNTAYHEAGLRGRAFLLLFDDITWRGNFVTVQAGKSFQDFIQETNEKGFEDLCPLSGIPGNLGAFVRGNAGAFGMETCDRLVSVDYWDEGGIIQTMRKEDCEFDYRHSVFKDHPDWCVARATFELSETCDPEVALEKTQDLFKHRWEKYPPGKTGGSTWKNPEGEFAGKLLEDLRAKGDQIGDMQITEVHANFIQNLRKGTQADLIALMRKWKDIVKKEKGITLHNEVMLYDDHGELIKL